MLKTRKRKSASADTEAPTGVLADSKDLRDGPTKEFREKHDVITRSSSVGGKRRYTQLEQFLYSGTITPEQGEAGRRFARDYTIALGRGKSCLSQSLSRGDASFYTQSIHDSMQRFREASAVIDTTCKAVSGALLPSGLMVRICVDDESIRSLSRDLGRHADTIQNRFTTYIEALADHYSKIDRKNGRSTTAYTKVLALRRFDPDLEEAARARKLR